MRLNRAATAIATVAIASAAIVSGCGVTHQGAVSVTHPAQHLASADLAGAHRVSAKLTAIQRPASIDPSLAWLESAGGQAQLTFNDEVDTLAAALQTEAHAPTVHNHLVFEADARVVRAEARKILRTRALLPKHNLAAYKRMLNDFITVANLLQPGPGYGTTHQDYVAWYKALNASNITVY
jgi:cytochrome c551/c552